jgi:hypothetical protein
MERYHPTPDSDTTGTLKVTWQYADRRIARYSPVVWGRVNMSPEGTAIPGRVEAPFV